MNIPGIYDHSFRRIAGIVNAVTGEVVPVDIEIHRDDMQWLIDLWQETFLLSWKIDVAAHEHHVQRSPQCRMTHTWSCLLSRDPQLPPTSTWP